MCMLLLTGCYTQFERSQRVLSDQYLPPDSVMSQDSVRAGIPDTLRVNNNQVCYWTKDIYGRPQLRCEDSYYGRDWYRYNNYPWWNSSSSYYYGDYNYNGWDEPCPAYYYYDNTCGACRYYRNYQGGHRDWWWNSSNRGSSSSTTSTQSRARHYRTDGIPTSSERSSGPAASQATRKQTVQPGSGSATVIGETGNSEKSTVRARRERTDGIPASNEVRQGDLNKQTEVERSTVVTPPPTPPPAPETSQQAPPPAPQPQNTSPQQDRSGQSNSSGDSHGERRNTRGW
jgi:hypothetical protein